MAGLVPAGRIASAPSVASELGFGLNAHVSTRCAIAGISADDWENGVLRIDAQCNAEFYRIRLLVDDQDIELSSAESLAEGADVQLRSGQALIRQDRPGSRQISLQVENPFALDGALSIRIEAL